MLQQLLLYDCANLQRERQTTTLRFAASARNICEYTASMQNNATIVSINNTGKARNS